MTRNRMVRSICALAAGMIIFGAGILVGQKDKQPGTVMHVVTLYWKEGTTAAQRQAALDGVAAMAHKYPGIKNVWIKSIKVQSNIGEHRIESAFAMEFESQRALDDYSGSSAQKEWYKTYLPARGESRTFDITN